jgi:energy-coupling factor transport system ATP-binding protein
MEDVAKLADRIIVMSEGKCILDGSPAEVFNKVDILESVGLAVPQVTYMVKKLREKGINISKDVFTVEQAKKELLKILNKGRRASK